MNPTRAATLVLAGIGVLMTVTSGAMTTRAVTRLQLGTSTTLLAASALALFFLYRGDLLRWVGPSVLPPSLRVLGGIFCLALALITSWAERPAFLSFPQLHAAWLLLLGCFLLVTVASDWWQWRQDHG